MKRILNNGFIVLFMAMLALPLVFVDLSPERISVEENRMLAAFPELADIKKHPGVFIHDFDAWFKDSTGFREQLVALYNGMSKDTWWNGILYTDGSTLYLVGEEGHHYHAMKWVERGKYIPVFQGRQFLSDEQLITMADKLEMVKTYLDSKGIPLVVMFCTSKESIYPEFLPKSIRWGGGYQLDRITEYLQEHTSVDVFNIRKALLAEKNSYLLYPVSGGDVHTLSHYSEIGAFFAYRELMRHINIHFPRIVPYELNDIDINYDEHSGVGVSRVSLKAEKVYKVLPSSFFDGVNFADIVMFGRDFNDAYENVDPSLPVILFLRTSFTDYYMQYISQHFGKTIMTHFVNMEYIEEYITRYKPDIVVIETVEYQLEMFADSVARIPELP